MQVSYCLVYAERLSQCSRLDQGRSQDFLLGGSPSPPSPSPPPSWGALPLYQLGGLGERCKLPQRGSANAFLSILGAQKRI